MLKGYHKTRVLAMLLLTMMVATPLLAGMTANYVRNQVATSLDQRPEAQRTGTPLVTQKWNHTIQPNTGYPTPAIADVDGDGKLEVIVAYFLTLESLNCTTGEIKRTYYVEGDPSFEESPAVADLYGNGKLEILISSYGVLTCDNGTTGGYLWQNYAYSISCSPAIGDINNDGKPEVVACDKSGYVFAFNGTTGVKLWQYPQEGNWIRSPPALADINQDGKLEVIVLRSNNTGDFVQCLNSTANSSGWVSPLWSYNVTGSSIEEEFSSPAVADIDNDGHMEVIVGTMSNKTYCLSDTGTLKWSYTTGGNIHSSPTIADIDGDGKKEVLIGSDDNKTYCLSSTGMLKWSYTTNGAVKSSPAVADVDGDKQLEVLVGSRDGYLYCLSSSGSLEWKYETKDWIDSSPVIADIDGDGKLEIIVESGDGYVYCLSVTSAPIAPNAYPWPSIGYRGDERHTGLATDSDKDGLTDNYEITVGTNPNSPDTDRDTATDYQEFLMSTNPFADTVSPEAITNLAATTSANTSITLTWTAPGNNGMSGNATGYWVKYSTSGPVTSANWASATNFTQSWVPAKNGTAETHVVTGLSPHTQYWFAIKAFDEVPNYGNVSNSPRLTTLTTGWQSNPPINLIPGPGNNATTPADVFGKYGFSMVTTNVSSVVVTSGSSLPLGIGSAPNGTTFLYLEIAGIQTNGTTGAAVYIYFNRTLVRSLGIDENTLQIRRWNSTTSEWDTIPSTVTILNITHGLITAHLNHFSYFAVLGSSSSGGSPMSPIIIVGAVAAVVVVVLSVIVLKKRNPVEPITGKSKAKRASAK